MKTVHNSKGEIKTPTDDQLYDILKKVPGVPSKFNLTSKQKYWWNWFAVEFVKTNQFSKVDLIHLQQAAFWLDARCQAFDFISTENEKGNLKGMVQKFKGGATNITGYMSIVKDADKAMDNISAHFGLSFKDRNKLGESKSVDPNQMDLFKSFSQKYSTAAQ